MQSVTVESVIYDSCSAWNTSVYLLSPVNTARENFISHLPTLVAKDMSEHTGMFFQSLDWIWDVFASYNWIYYYRHPKYTHFDISMDTYIAYKGLVSSQTWHNWLWNLECQLGDTSQLGVHFVWHGQLESLLISPLFISFKEHFKEYIDMIKFSVNTSIFMSHSMKRAPYVSIKYDMH